mmetsp:Transcript_46190/g.76974  ORF Transcript_46190/g.76974 Transcript_46190/m.76974 type:complete len:234 (-) Transcript_46190:296-997(-)
MRVEPVNLLARPENWVDWRPRTGWRSETRAPPPALAEWLRGWRQLDHRESSPLVPLFWEARYHRFHRRVAAFPGNVPAVRSNCRTNTAGSRTPGLLSGRTPTRIRPRWWHFRKAQDRASARTCLAQTSLSHIRAARLQVKRVPASAPRTETTPPRSQATGPPGPLSPFLIPPTPDQDACSDIGTLRASRRIHSSSSTETGALTSPCHPPPVALAPPFAALLSHNITAFSYFGH